MKNCLHLLILIVLLLAHSSVLAKENLEISLTGISGNALKNVEDRLSALKDSYGKNISANDIQHIYKMAPLSIRNALQPYGYFHASIRSDIKNHDSMWTAHFDITHGPQIKIIQVDIQITGPGKTDNQIQKILKDFPLQTGQPLLIENYNNALQTLFQTVNAQAYLKAWVEQKEIRINMLHNTAIIIIHLNTGPRYYFGPVTFTKTPFSEKFLGRFVSFQEHQAFSTQELLKFQQDLGNSQYFQEVIVNPNFEQSHDNVVPIQVETIPRKAKQFNFGIGYGTFTGPRFTAESNFRHVTDTGQHFNLQLKLSPVISGLGGKYFIPGKNPLTDQYTIGMNFQQFAPNYGRSFSENLTGSYVKNLGEWQQTFSLNYLRERFTINQNPWQSSNLLYPSLSISHLKTDALLNPHSGNALTFNLQGSSDRWLSQINFLQSEIKGKWIFSPTEASRFILRGNLGYTVVQDLQKLPLSLQFFAGGPNSVRGYGFDSIGPGRYLKTGSVEFQHRIIGDWNVGVFYDGGMASNHFNSGYQHSRGIGVIYNSVIGPIKIYVARADSSPGKPLRIDFNIGPDL